MATIQIIGHIVITVIAVFGLGIRLEHRLTKIETDTKWMKETIDKKFNGGI
ncbi:MAG TPA: hypothetical protein VMY06_03225 [Sedimentisphaerales bacterium]|nr:hypothetical protein [Sedimentisphaerales bacterium]